jgi:hypothetical protein
LFYNESRRNSSDDRNNPRMDSEGQVEDYFKTDRDPFGDANSPA